MNNQGNEQIKNQLILTSSEKIVLDNYKFLGTWSSKITLKIFVNII